MKNQTIALALISFFSFTASQNSFSNSCTYSSACKLVDSYQDKYYCVFDSGDTYEGKMDLNCERKSQGTYTWKKTGIKYLGNWSLNKRHGKGSLFYKDGTRWTGNYNMGTRTYGTYYGEGFKRVGAYRKKRADGIHIETYDNGEKREQIWKEGEFISQKTIRTAEEYRVEQENAKISAAKRREEQNKWDTIYNNCVLDKSKGQDISSSTIRKSIEKVCGDIASNPSYWELFKYQ